MSLYESSNKNVSINSFFSNARLPIWVLVIAAYLALTTFINQISNLSSYIVEGVFEAKYLWGILGNLTGLISIVALLIFLLKKNVLCLYYLVVTSVASFAFGVAFSLGNKEIMPLRNSLRGLDFIPYPILIHIIESSIGWSNVSESFGKVIQLINGSVSISFSGLLFYFKIKSHSKIN